MKVGMDGSKICFWIIGSNHGTVYFVRWYWKIS